MSFKSQQGFSLPIAVFILVILALLASVAVTLMNRGQQSVSQEILSTRAFYAAESAAQLALQRLFPLNGGAANCPATTTLNFNTTGLNACQSSVSCSSLVAGSRTLYTLRSRASCNSGDLVTVREIEVRAQQ